MPSIKGSSGRELLNGASGHGHLQDLVGQDAWTAPGAGRGSDLSADAAPPASPDGATLEVGAGGFATIQEAIDAAQAGDTIHIAAGTYSGNIVVSKDGLNIV